MKLALTALTALLAVAGVVVANPVDMSLDIGRKGLGFGFSVHGDHGEHDSGEKQSALYHSLAEETASHRTKAVPVGGLGSLGSQGSSFWGQTFDGLRSDGGFQKAVDESSVSSRTTQTEVTSVGEGRGSGLGTDPTSFASTTITTKTVAVKDVNDGAVPGDALRSGSRFDNVKAVRLGGLHDGGSVSAVSLDRVAAYPDYESQIKTTEESGTISGLRDGAGYSTSVQSSSIKASEVEEAAVGGGLGREVGNDAVLDSSSIKKTTVQQAAVVGDDTDGFDPDVALARRSSSIKETRVQTAGVGDGTDYGLDGPSGALVQSRSSITNTAARQAALDPSYSAEGVVPETAFRSSVKSTEITETSEGPGSVLYGDGRGLSGVNNPSAQRSVYVKTTAIKDVTASEAPEGLSNNPIYSAGVQGGQRAEQVVSSWKDGVVISDGGESSGLAVRERKAHDWSVGNTAIGKVAERMTGLKIGGTVTF